MKVKKFVLGLMPVVFALTFSSFAMAKDNIVVTPTNTQGWWSFTTPGGTAELIKDPSSPAGNDAIQLTTNNTIEAVAELVHEANTPLSAVTELSYYTKQVSGNPSVADPFYYLTQVASY